jgi:hypothetical protein
MEEIFKGGLKNHNIAKSKQIDPYLNLFRQSLQISGYTIICDIILGYHKNYSLPSSWNK